MKTLHLVWLLALMVGELSIAQAQTPKPIPLPTIDAIQNQRWVVKFAPLSMLDPSNTIQFGIERLFGRHQSLQAEFGYGTQGMDLWDTSQKSRYTNHAIWRGRAEWRYYWHGGPIGSYVALEGLYKQINAHENGTVGIGCDTGPCQYYQMYSAPISKQVWAGSIKFGRQFKLLKNSNRLLVDFYGGIGIRWGMLDRSNVPNGLPFFRSGSLDLFSTTYYPTGSVSYGIKFGYSF